MAPTMFLEEHARLLLVLHTALATALVAASTHLVIWMRGYPRGQFRRHRAVVRFATITAVLFVTTFVAGNLLYPTYKTRVRFEFFDRGSAIANDVTQRGENRRRAAKRLRESRAFAAEQSDERALPQPLAEAEPVTGRAPRQAAKIARWFDVKEHWIALGMFLSLACAVILRTWDPRKDGSIGLVVFGFAVAAAATTWLAAVVGIVTTSYRSVGTWG